MFLFGRGLGLSPLGSLGGLIGRGGAMRAVLAGGIYYSSAQVGGLVGHGSAALRALGQPAHGPRWPPGYRPLLCKHKEV